MKLSKLTLNLVLATFLGTAAYAAAASPETEDSAASNPGVETPDATIQGTNVTAIENVVAGETAEQPAPASDAVEPSKTPACNGFGHCAGQVVKDVVGAVVGLAVGVLYFGLMTGLIFLL
jgi:hypothetical protein